MNKLVEKNKYQLEKLFLNTSNISNSCDKTKTGRNKKENIEDQEKQTSCLQFTNIESIVDLRLQLIQLQKVEFKPKALRTLMRKCHSKVSKYLANANFFIFIF